MGTNPEVVLFPEQIMTGRPSVVQTFTIVKYIILQNGSLFSPLQAASSPTAFLSSFAFIAKI